MECDSTLYNDTGIKATKTHQPYNLFFNPDINLFQIKNLSVEELEVHLFDGLGRSARVIKVQEGICTLVGKDSAMGLYFYIVYCRGVVVGSGKLPVY